MKVIVDNMWFCIDCTMLAVNGDASGMSDEQEKRSTEGLDDLGAHIVPDFDSETGEGYQDFARPARGCDCCGSGLAGTFHRFAQLGEDS